MVTHDPIQSGGHKDGRGPMARWEMAVLATAVVLVFSLGLPNLAEPSLWHDELVHVFVAKSMAETGEANLPSGMPYGNAAVFNAILAGVVRVWGLSEATVRTPSVFLAAGNVLMLFFLTRPILGRWTALVSAFGLALSPWAVAWSREARFYTLQQGLYLATLGCFWQVMVQDRRRTLAAWGGGCATAYGLGVLTSFHSILFLGPLGAYVLLMGFLQRTLKSRWTVLVCLVGLAGVVTLISYFFLMNPLDREAVFERGGLGGRVADVERASRLYYTLWLQENLSVGFFILALFGFAAMVFREGRRGAFMALAFWVPIVVLTFFIGYRRPRFMFFAFPFYVAAFSYGLVFLAQWLGKPKISWASWGVAALVVLFAVRLAWSEIRLVQDSLEAAGGAHTTLARRHPQWKKPCAYVREHGEGAAVVTTTFLPVLYYVGRADNWYPTHNNWWEVDEAGMDDLKTPEDLARFVAQHPRGFYLAEKSRFDRYDFMDEYAGWVKKHLTVIEEGSSDDVTLFAWGL